MSGKKAKKARKARITCCGRALGRSVTECPRCHRVVTKAGMDARLRKAVAAQARAAAFITKAAAPGAAYCPFGHRQVRAGGNVCCECTVPLVPVPPMSLIGKSAFATGHWERELADSPDSGRRELWQQLRYGSN